MLSGALPDWINQDSLVFYNDLSLYPDFGGVVLAETESQRIADYLCTNKAIILQVSQSLTSQMMTDSKNHGLLTVGQSIESAVLWFIILEKVCRMQLLVDATGRKPIPIGKEEAQFT
jgi:ribulose-5-phosphate 4-epimerase/fuculose-1-phosphate aldolase